MKSLIVSLVFAVVMIGCADDLKTSETSDEICVEYACGSDGQNCSHFPQGCGGDGNGGSNPPGGGDDTGGGGSSNWACQTQTNCSTQVINADRTSGYGTCYNTGVTVSACGGHQMYMCAITQELVQAQYCNGVLCSAIPFIHTWSDLCVNREPYNGPCVGYTAGMDACTHAAPVTIDPPPPPPILPPGDGGGPCSGSRCPVEQGVPIQNL